MNRLTLIALLAFTGCASQPIHPMQAVFIPPGFGRTAQPQPTVVIDTENEYPTWK